MSQEPMGGEERVGKEKGKKDSKSEGGHEQEFTAGLPSQVKRALGGQFAFMEMDRHFDLPTAGIGQDDEPGLIWGGDRLAVEQIPGSTTQSRTCNDEP